MCEHYLRLREGMVVMEQIEDPRLEPPAGNDYDCECDNEECDTCEDKECECSEHDTGCTICKQEKGCSCDEQYDRWKERND